MPIFKYQAKDMKGEVIAGTMDVENRNAVISRLQAMQYFPLKIEAEKTQAEKESGSLFGSRIKSNDICELYRQMADLISAGITLVKALQIVSSQTPSLALRTLISQVAADVQGGDTFGEALNKHPKTFTKLSVALITSGERGGFLPDVLEQLATFAELEEELKGKIKAALAYPLVMVFVGTAAVIFLMTFVMPKILTIYEQTDRALPAPTQLMMLISDLLSKQWLLLIAGLVLFGFMFWRLMKSKEGRRFIHKSVLRLPVFGQIVLKREISRFARTFGQMLKNGVPMLHALDIVKDVATNDLIRDAIIQTPNDITQGAGVSEALKKHDIFPRGVVNMIAIGEETGRLPDVLLQIAPSYEAQADRLTKAMTSLIEPLIIVAMGIVVGFIVIATLLPILTMNVTS